MEFGAKHCGSLRRGIIANLSPSDPQIPGIELFRRCAGSRDREAWNEFHRRYNPTLIGVVVNTLSTKGVRNGNDVDDLVSDVYVRLCQHDGRALRSFTPTSPNSDFAYLKVIARNVVMDRLSNLRGKASRLEDVDLSGIRDDSAVNLQRELLLKRMEEIVNRTATDRDRLVFWLYYRAGLTAQQIAKFESIGLSPKGVESALSRVVRTVRDALGQSLVKEKTGKRGSL